HRECRSVAVQARVARLRRPSTRPTLGWAGSARRHRAFAGDPRIPRLRRRAHRRPRLRDVRRGHERAHRLDHGPRQVARRRHPQRRRRRPLLARRAPPRRARRVAGGAGMKTLRLFRMLSSARSSGTATFALPIVAFAVVTALLLIVLGGAFAFFGWSGSGTDDYKYLASIALALLVVPLLTLGGSAARLSARRRDDRLSTLRLLGATPALVARLTVIESAALALLGALVGIVVYAALVPAVGLIPFRGEALGGSVWLAPWVVGIVVLGVAALAALSATIGLRGVIVSPLGVRTRRTTPRPHWVRLVFGVVAVIVVYTAMKLLRADAGVITVLLVFGLGFGLTIAVLNLAGPFVLRLVAKAGVRRAKTPQHLLAARGILESPKAAWRQVSGVAMTSFIAVFAGVGIAVTNSMGSTSDSLEFVFDIRTGVIITLVASFLMVACSVGVNQASAILDRRDLYLSL